MYRKVKTKTSNKIIPVIVIIIGLLLIGAAVVVLLKNRNPKHSDALPTNPIVKQENDIDYSPPSPEQKDTSNQQKDDIVKQDQSTPSTDTSLAVTITRANQDPSGLNIRTIVTGTSSGSCQITASKAGQASIVKTVPIVMDATTANCQNKPIATSDFPVGGNWNIEVVVLKDSTKSPPANITVTINK